MTFDHTGYELKFVQTEPCRDGSFHVFTRVYKFCSPVTKLHYVLRADYHMQDVFAIKFYCKKDKRSDHKYSKIVNKGDLGNILITCLKVVPLLLMEFPTASFSFIGARTIDKASQKVEKIGNNQRFRVYKDIVARKIGTLTFEHIEYRDISGYLLLNRWSNNLREKEESIKTMFEETYPNLLDSF